MFEKPREIAITGGFRGKRHLLLAYLYKLGWKVNQEVKRTTRFLIKSANHVGAQPTKENRAYKTALDLQIPIIPLDDRTHLLFNPKAQLTLRDALEVTGKSLIAWREFDWTFYRLPAGDTRFQRPVYAVISYKSAKFLQTKPPYDCMKSQILAQLEKQILDPLQLFVEAPGTDEKFYVGWIKPWSHTIWIMDVPD
jgi:hypothetical protein